MSTCHRFQDDLALLAGDDLGVPAWELRAHVEGCEACRATLDRLRGMVDGVRRSAPALAAPQASLLPGVLAHLAADAHDLRPDHRREAPQALTPFIARAAAALLLVGATSWLGFELLERDGAAGQEQASAVSATGAPIASVEAPGAQAPRNVTIRKAAGEGLELTWDSDGREGGAMDAQSARPYRVLASASPKDFSSARPVEVVGHRVVASMPLPSLRRADRSVTFFRVE